VKAPGTERDKRRVTLAAAVVLLIVAAGHVATLRRGHSWAGDFAMYVRLAANLAEGRPVADTGYIYNPAYASLGPRLYPPVYPLLLAPVYGIWGLSLVPMKAELVLLLCAFLWLFYLAHRRHAAPIVLLAAMLTIGLNPYLLRFKNSVLSDIPFLLFAYAALSLMRDAPPGAPPRRALADGLLLGGAMYLAYGTRAVGLVLIPTLLAAELIRTRRLTRRTGFALAAFALLAALQACVWPGTGSYLDQLNLDPRLMARKVEPYLNMLNHDLWENGYSRLARNGLFAATLALALIGYVARLRRRATAFEIFPVFYLAAVILWPANQGTRFLIPVIPLYVLFAFDGLWQLRVLQRRNLRLYAVAGLVAVVLASYAGRAARGYLGPIREGVHVPERRALFQHVRDQTPPDAVFIFRKPRILALYTNRRASKCRVSSRDDELWRYIRRIGATHLIVSSHLDRPFLKGFVERNGARVHQTFSNAHFAVYRIRSAPGHVKRSAHQPFAPATIQKVRRRPSAHSRASASRLPILSTGSRTR